ncbi:mechanosensitive ion channel family protein, partial [Vibrio sp. 10N.222.49.C9]
VFHLSVLTWWLHNVIAAFEGYFLRKPDRDQTTASAVAKVAKIVLYSISGMVFLSQLGVNLSAIMTFSGMSGLALGFAAKDIVANFMSSLVIHWENQIKLGQWISSPDEDIEGIVRAINMRTVEIERFDKYPMFIPTSKIVSMSISNH